MSVKGESYKSASAMRKHEKTESASMRAKEYGSAKKAHPGFKAVATKIAKKQGISKDRAGAILAASARKASAKAVAANPRLKKISGVKKGK
jgi:hypothetical protein